MVYAPGAFSGMVPIRAFFVTLGHLAHYDGGRAGQRTQEPGVDAGTVRMVVRCSRVFWGQDFRRLKADMNTSSFFKHWSIRENPFMAEEARQDDVFARLQDAAAHPDFPKLLGDPSRPASAVVFGEKGSGKTAIRFQLEEAIENYNAANPHAKSLVVGYDDLNPVLDRFARRVRGKTTLETLQQIRLVDHFDGLLSMVVPDLVEALLRRNPENRMDLGPQRKALCKQLDPETKNDWVILQALFDRPDRAVENGRRVRRAVRFRKWSWVRPFRWLAVLLAAIFVCGLGVFYLLNPQDDRLFWLLGLTLSGIFALGAGGKVFLDWYENNRLARKLSRELRTLDRSAASLRASLDRLPTNVVASTAWPVDGLDEPRYAMLDRLRRAVSPFGFRNLIVLIDRLDEPTLINGEIDRMKAVIWPVFNNKFLQQAHVAFKMMLPLELRHVLRRESSDFFQEARLDKQNLIERLSWSGATLFDLCNARINACLESGAERISLRDIFDESVSRQDLVDALDQMKQPRDAFKLLYQVIQDHCNSSTEEEENWRIPKLILDQARRLQAERVEELHRGLRPA